MGFLRGIVRESRRQGIPRPQHASTPVRGVEQPAPLPPPVWPDSSPVLTPSPQPVPAPVISKPMHTPSPTPRSPAPINEKQSTSPSPLQSPEHPEPTTLAPPLPSPPQILTREASEQPPPQREPEERAEREQKEPTRTPLEETPPIERDVVPPPRTRVDEKREDREISLVPDMVVERPRTAHQPITDPHPTDPEPTTEARPPQRPERTPNIRDLPTEPTAVDDPPVIEQQSRRQLRQAEAINEAVPATSSETYQPIRGRQDSVKSRTPTPPQLEPPGDKPAHLTAQPPRLARQQETPQPVEAIVQPPPRPQPPLTHEQPTEVVAPPAPKKSKALTTEQPYQPRLLRPEPRRPQQVEEKPPPNRQEAANEPSRPQRHRPEKPAPPKTAAPPRPEVHIGRIEVTVIEPPGPQPAPAPTPLGSTNLAARHYLRRL